ncbi:MAG: tetratricopeptide repeat protein [Anaerolineales bacterium]|nr:tetratricopeptide repeat protein [Anaerolineales bacterium]
MNAEAISYFSRALALTADEALMQRYYLLQAREQVYHLQGERDNQLQDITVLQALAEQIMQAGGEDKRAEAALRLANYAEVTGDYKTAVSSAHLALEQAQGSQDVVQETASHLALGRVLIRQGNYEDARTHLNGSLTLAQTHHLSRFEADTRRFLGVAAVDLGQYQEARDFYHQSLILYCQIEDPQGESTVLNNLAIVVYSLGDLSESVYFWEQAQKIYNTIGDREGRGRILTNLCALCIGLGEFETAREYGLQGLQICREINARIGECMNLLNLGLVSHYTDHADLANQYSTEARQIADAMGNALLKGYTLLDSGVILAEQHQLDKAQACLQEAVELWQNLDQTSRLLETKAEIARIAFKRNDVEKAQTELIPVIDHILANASLDGTARPFQIYFICYEVLTAVSDPRATTILDKAYHLLHERALRIRNDTQRLSFLENIPSHHLIIQAFEA